MSRIPSVTLNKSYMTNGVPYSYVVVYFAFINLTMHNLTHVFGINPHVQRTLIVAISNELDTLYDEIMDTFSPATLHGTFPASSNDPPIDRDHMPPPSSGTDITTLLSYTNIEPDYTSVHFIYNAIKQHIHWLLFENTSHNVLIWTVVCLFYLFPKLCDHVSEHTEPSIAIPYFRDFHSRFDRQLCGSLIEKEHRKHSNVVNVNIACHTPLQITITELMRLDFIRSGKPCEETSY